MRKKGEGEPERERRREVGREIWRKSEKRGNAISPQTPRQMRRGRTETKAEEAG